MKYLLYAILFICFCFASKAQKMEPIRLNQVGFYPNAPKIAVALGNVPP